MSISEVRSIWPTIDWRSCGIVCSVYIGPSGRTAGMPVAGSGAQLRNAGLVGQARVNELAKALPNRSVGIEIGQPAEQQELVRGLAPPAPIEIDLCEEQVDRGVCRGDRDREVAGVDGRHDPPGPAMCPSGGQE